MEITLPQAVFLFLAAVIVVFSILTVTTKRILRSATYLLFVLFATAGIYFELNYSFLGAVQLTVYAGGIIVLYVFSILLTSSDNRKVEKNQNQQIFRRASGCHRRSGDLYLYHADPFIPRVPFRTRRNRPESHRHGTDGHGEVPVFASFRGDQHIAADLYRRRHTDSQKTIMTIRPVPVTL